VQVPLNNAGKMRQIEKLAITEEQLALEGDKFADAAAHFRAQRLLSFLLCICLTPLN